LTWFLVFIFVLTPISKNSKWNQPAQLMWKNDYYKLNLSGVVDLIGITLSTSFTWLTTFVRKHHSFSYSIFFDSPQRLHPNGIFSQYSQNWKSCYFKTLVVHIFFKSNFLKHTRIKSYNLQKDLSNSVLHAPIKNHLTFVLRGFVVEIWLSIFLGS
jgi:hypothetical protein